MKPWRLRALVATVAVAAVALSVTGPAAAAPATSPVLDVASIAFDRTQVDVTEDYATVNLNWTITNRAAKARGISGVVELRQFAGSEQIGQPRTVSYNLDWGRAQVGGSGTAQESTYAYQFTVPRYAPVAQTFWRVTKVTIADDVAHARTVRDPGPAALTVAQIVDAEGPVAEQLYFDFDQPRSFYDDGSGVTLRYAVYVVDNSGFKKGKLTLTGPSGRRVSGTFQLTRDGSQWSCNGQVAWDPTWLTCSIPVTVPAGSPSGTWRVSRLDLTDSWGNTRTDTSPEGAAPVQVSRNEVLSASNFALTKAEVNNWRGPASTALTFRPQGMVGGLASVDLELSWCSQPSHTPVVGDDGSASVEIVLQSSWMSSCSINGVRLTDGAGNVALYGAAYGAPDLGLTVTRVKDEKAPVVLSATLPKATWTQQETEDAWGLGFDVTVEVDDFAKIQQFSATIYDSNGEPKGGMSGGEHDDGTGVFRLAVSTGRMEPGQYTIGFSLTDEAGNDSAWGYPNNAGNPIPNGPLVLTVVPD
ncbi:hypothetical protein [Micromonospora chokoriensis]|uniref:Ig-like domain-containing protein n=1 Tax=Micromonospora chokoriensis TaxID=356851 RepID=A0A1C4V2E8_9ACTN|nr:hypothetical protein [Micromonospora chokoriensis]SCE78093.1 hypothetical protein GA0070612_0996 [Micromonospora chokoriensis]